MTGAAGSPPADVEDGNALGQRVGRAAQSANAASAALVGPPENATVAKGIAPKPQASPRRHTTVEPKIFVSPRAPDDPGLEAEPGSHGADGGELESSRPGSAKA